MTVKKRVQNDETDINSALREIASGAQKILRNLQFLKRTDALFWLPESIPLDVFVEYLLDVKRGRKPGRPKRRSNILAAASRVPGRPRTRQSLKKIAQFRSQVDEWDKAAGRKNLNQKEFATLLACRELAKELGCAVSEITAKERRSKDFQRRVRLFQDEVSAAKKILPENPSKN